MTLVNWSPLRELDDIFERYNRAFRRPVPATAAESSEVVQWRPVANISETDREYIIKAELPEVAKEDVQVTVQEGVITIRGERRYERSDESEKQHRVESFYGSFARSFSLPADADEKGIRAESRDGILKALIPKAEEVMPQQIDIQVK